MFDNLKNMWSMMGQAKDIRAKIEQVQAELARKVVEGESGAGAVRVRVNGKFEVLSVELDRPLLSTLASPGDGEAATDADLKMIEDLVAAAMNAALAKARDLVQEQFRQAAGGLNIPGLDKLMGG
ncbi:MAG: YbaB/EbfC family nucleoid-associated protein [Phycisphaeraceae bacterium]